MYPEFDLVKLYHPGGIVDHQWGDRCPCERESYSALQERIGYLTSDNEDLQIEVSEMRAELQEARERIAELEACNAE